MPVEGRKRLVVSSPTEDAPTLLPRRRPPRAFSPDMIPLPPPPPLHPAAAEEEEEEEEEEETLPALLPLPARFVRPTAFAARAALVMSMPRATPTPLGRREPAGEGGREFACDGRREPAGDDGREFACDGRREFAGDGGREFACDGRREFACDGWREPAGDGAALTLRLPATATATASSSWRGK
jgi:hypothetical protein